MNILIIYSEKLTEKHLDTVERAKNILKDENILVVKSCDLTETCFDNQNLVITIGGDGTFIRATSFIKDIPILGINSESHASEGALTSIDETQLDFLKEIINNGKIKKMGRIKVLKNNIPLKELAVNDVYIGTASQFHTSRYNIHFNGKEEEQRSSGVLVVNSHGSTAWYKSAGGQPFSENKLKFLVREPYVGNRVFRPTILYGELSPETKFHIECKRYDGAIIALDSNSVFNLNFGDVVQVGLADYFLNVLVK